jgi:nucleoside-diphosphate-sugar epimerase
MIGIIGGKGFIGSAIAREIEHLDPVIITRENNNNYKDTRFDTLINAAGNSKKYIADQHPVKDFRKSVVETHDYIHTYKFDKYIHISTVDVLKDSRYGKNRALVEELIRRYTNKHIIIRCSSVIGPGMKKGILKDILEKKPVRVSRNSRIQFVTAKKIGQIVKLYIEGILPNWEVVLAAGTNGLSPDEIGKIVGKKVSYIRDADLASQYYNFNPTHLRDVLTFKTSEEYIREALNERME